MLVKIQGILVDGSGTATPVGQAISLPQGMDATVQLSVTNQAGAAVDLTAYQGLRLTVKSASVGGIPIASIAAVISDPTHGVCTFTLPGATTRQLLGTYVYDVVSTNGSGGRDEVVPDSFLEINQAVGA